jgi:hypothetical protein
MTYTAKAMEVWNTLLERSQGDEEKFYRLIDAFLEWASMDGRSEVTLAANAIRSRVVRRTDKPLVRWGLDAQV